MKDSTAGNIGRSKNQPVSNEPPTSWGRMKVSQGPGTKTLRKLESIDCVRLRRQAGCQNLGFSSRPFVLCGLPIKRPPAGTLVHERRNGHFVLLVTGHPNYGLPWGQDRLVPLFLATLATRQHTPRITFASGADTLETFGMQQGGSQYRRLIGPYGRSWRWPAICSRGSRPSQPLDLGAPSRMVRG